ncbi:MFS transporter, MCP family, solute carrier family 16, member 10 [Bisporella sp. PMI_857]|nr:MFS transporter, MCP family, solute carrier family 16, member 10 [Bisporella sp. PMI_857]
MTGPNQIKCEKGVEISNQNEISVPCINDKCPGKTQESQLVVQNPENGDPAPSSNLLACLQVLGAFFMMFNSWGVANTFGAFQIYYEGAILSDQSPSNISWIGSIQAFLLLFVGGLCTGQIYDEGHMRALVLCGSFFTVLGMMLIGICKEYWQLVLAQGVLQGFGAGCLLLPSVAVMPQYFTKRRAFATGIGASGSSAGGVMYPIMFHKLLPRLGFAWTTRVMAFTMLGTLMIPILVMRAKSFPAERRPFVDLKVVRNIPYMLFSMGEFFGMMGMFIPFYYLSTYSLNTGFATEDQSFYLLSILNAASVCGRILPNFFADIIGPLNMMTPFSAVCGIVAFTWTSISTLGSVVTFCIFYGFFSGTFISATGPALATISKDIALVGTHMGQSFAFGGLGLLVGNPVAGVLLDRYGWIAPACFCGTCNILAAVFVMAARVKEIGWGLRSKT